MGEQELSFTLWIGGFLLTIIGTLIVFAWGSIVYIFSRHRDDNDSEHDELYEIIHRHETDLTELKTEHKIYRGKCSHEPGV